jgi:predicted O-methyltransferase YrrM
MRQLEFGGGLGDVLNLCYFTDHYELLSTRDETQVFLTGHNPHVYELFRWHPASGRLKVIDLGFLPPWSPHSERRKVEGGLTNPEPYQFVYHDRVEFYPSPDDKIILEGLPASPSVVFSLAASSSERTFPQQLADEIVDRAIAQGVFAIITGSRYRLGDRRELQFRPRTGLLDLTDRLSVPGTIQLCERAQGIVTCHSAFCLVGWHLRKPVLLGYDSSTKTRVAQPTAMNHWFGIDRRETVHFSFERYGSGEWDSFISSLEDSFLPWRITLEDLGAELLHWGGASVVGGLAWEDGGASFGSGPSRRPEDYSELAAISRLTSPRSLLLIGVDQGHSLVAMVRGSRGIQEVWGVDGGCSEGSSIQVIRANVRAAGCLSSVHLAHETSRAYFSRQDRKMFDLVHVADSESPQALFHDIRAGWSRLNGGGVLIVDRALAGPGSPAPDRLVEGLPDLAHQFQSNAGHYVMAKRRRAQ